MKSLLTLAFATASLPLPLEGVVCQPNTFDVTNQTDIKTLARACPGLLDDDGNVSPVTWSVAHASINADQLFDSYNAMFPTQRWLERGKTTRIRFAEVPGDGYTQGSFSVGLTTEDTFGANYDISGLFQGSEGNLQTSTSAVFVHFTSSLTGGVMTDWYIDVNDRQIDVYIVTDSVRYGHAFSIPTNHVDGLISKLKPVVRFSKDASGMALVAVIWPAQPIGNAEYHQKQTMKGRGIFGEWMDDAGDKLTITETQSKLMNLETDIRVNVKVVNSMNAQFKLDLMGHVLSKSPIITTLMMGDDVSMQREQNIGGLLSCATHIMLDETRNLLVKCPTQQMIFRRFTDREDRAVVINPWDTSIATEY